MDKNSFVDRILFTKDDLEKSQCFIRFLNKARLDMMPTLKECSELHASVMWFNGIHQRIQLNLKQQIEAKEIELKVLEKDEQEKIPVDHTEKEVV